MPTRLVLTDGPLSARARQVGDFDRLYSAVLYVTRSVHEIARPQTCMNLLPLGNKMSTKEPTQVSAK